MRNILLLTVLSLTIFVSYSYAEMGHGMMRNKGETDETQTRSRNRIYSLVIG